MIKQLITMLLLSAAFPLWAQENAKTPTDQGTQREAEFIPSYGTDPLILLYAPKDIIPYLDNIKKYERDGFEIESLTPEEKATLDIEDITDPEAPPAPPIIFPHYHVASIMYDTPTSWSVYINGILITSSNNSKDKELYVRYINRDVVTLIWTPQDERLIEQMQHDKQHNDIATLPPFMEHRIVAQRNNNSVRILNDSIRFTLEPNQFFASGYLALLEGNPRALNIVTYYPDGLPDSSDASAQDTTVRMPSAPKSVSPDAVASSVPESYNDQIHKRKTVGERMRQDLP